LRYTAVGINSYQITHEKWFDADYVNPSVQLIEGLQVTPDTFFGKNGTLHLIPIEVLVMYKPNIEVTISTQCYKDIFSRYEDQKVNVLNLFGYKLRVGASGKLEPIAGTNDTVTLNFPGSALPTPQIVGVISQVLYNGH
jgi:hypothetical protein